MSCRFEGPGARGRGPGATTRAISLVAIAILVAVPQRTFSQNSPLVPGPRPLAPSYEPHRVFDTHRNQFIDFESLLVRLSRADLVFVGEQHDDPSTHRMQLAVLEGIARRRDSVVLALEMFERDVQPLLDRYLRGEMSEDSLLGSGRPWKRYATDYRPLVEFARERGWPVIASNVPRPLASLVARTGLPGLDTLAPDSRQHAAEQLDCPRDRYYERFVKAMGDVFAHGPTSNGDSTDAELRIRRMYEAQCLKDETMAESIARVWRPGRLVVHVNGAFHTDFGHGTAARAAGRLRAMGGSKPVVVAAVPAPDLDRLKPSRDDRKRGDFLLYVLAPAKRDSVPR
ncbi:MAG: ChaN family lipoprotein [Gemmatimonadales bacterium]